MVLQVEIAGYGSLPTVGASPQPQRRAAYIIACVAALAMVSCVGIAVAGYDQVGSKLNERLLSTLLHSNLLSHQAGPEHRGPP